ncbi:MAG: carboxyl transferase domain-containing protein [Pseudomonadales bacterium]|jgi:acetyl/propionyl-CoA carboxylase alpha subunit/acetyl-CoA carboxylase carboxyltransferase component|nr:carboxyl transferase domain-containing protein [Pseudomonadales bacterium]HJN51883.1 carboxyl transferase domain-containing protein [Pseudomonadales bacterium]|tara:strand:+ start:734 stop:4237 length:3504 start_codon:yes stop_codon:yes gene_type:complete
MKLLVANRGEIAIRILRAAAELDIATVAVYSGDEEGSLHTGKADDAVALEGVGAAAYLDIEQIIAVARSSGCDAVHPGYGFLAENAELARRCGEASLTFIGPRVETLELFGDKARARIAAAAADVPVVRGLDQAVSLGQATEFWGSIGEGRGMMIKAIAGGGGRGSRVVTSADEIEATFERCRSEAEAAFGNGDLYVEEFIQRARHVEVQVLGDLHGAVAHLGERECSIQRHFQKVVEVAPAPGLPVDLRDQIIDAAMRCARSVGYANAGTFEFLVDASESDGAQPFAFIEANARLQVEHTVTEAVTGVDIVQAQLRLAEGASIAELGLDDPRVAEPRGYAIQARVCMETMREDGSFQPAAGTLAVYEVPSGPGVRTDGFGYSGYQTSLSFDSLLAKVIGHSTSANFADAIAKTTRALSEFRIEGVDTNIPFLHSILAHDDFATGNIHTRYVDEHIAELAATSVPRRRFVEPIGGSQAPTGDSAQQAEGSGGFAGARVDDAWDPLALFKHDTQVKSDATEETNVGPVEITMPVLGTIVSIDVAVDDAVTVGRQLAVIEAMGLRHVVKADRSGIVQTVSVSVDDAVNKGEPIILLMEGDVEGGVAEVAEEIDPDYIRSDLAQVYERRSYIYDSFREEKVERRHAKGQRTARENIDQLLDEGTFKEFGPLVTAGSWQKQQWLRETTPTDGMIMGIGGVNGDKFDPDRARVVVAHYDYMVVAGTQGGRGHYKQDRLYEMARRFRLPVILFAEGGGGRPGISGGESEARSTPGPTGSASGTRYGMSAVSGAKAIDAAAMAGGGVGMDCYTFTEFSMLSGLVPLVGVNSGRCFAGNTALLACCDIIIASANSTIAMGGPAMIEGGGLGIYTPEEVGPMSFQVPNGVVDILVEDDEAAVETAKQYISYFQGPVDQWEAPDQRRLRHLVPEDRLKMYDMRQIIETLVDEGSILEIRREFGPALITSLVRIEGQPMGLIANNPHHFSGAIDSDASDKGARFLQLCDTFDLPVVSLMDCPGTMAGAEHERTALVRHFARMFTTGANLSVPMLGVVVRKAYGLGVLAMCGTSSVTPLFTVAWPTAEFAGASIDGMAKFSAREGLEGVNDPEEREAIYQEHLATFVEGARAVNSGGTNYGVDDVIDPADTRGWIVQGLRSVPAVPARTGKKRPNVDTW